MKEEETTEHFTISRLQLALKDNPSATWMKEWIHMAAYDCSCDSCLKILKDDDVDVNMIDKIFSG
jgi:hypothetical protein